jgi:glycosyltransferase involved in cell wall biosynthesis
MHMVQTVSVVIPAYNQAGTIEHAVAAVERQLGALRMRYEIIIAEDGSTDGTYEKCLAIARRHRNVVLLHSARRLGRGRAICRAFAMASGSILAFVDSDMASHPRHIKKLIWLASEYDVVTGSRYLPQSRAKRYAVRLFFSRGYNLLVRLLFGSALRYHQCGFKAFRRSAALALCRAARDAHFFWDTEALVYAQRMHMRIKELPIEWREQDSSTVNLRRDVFAMGAALLRLKFKLPMDGLL